MTDLEKVLAYEEIRQLASRYAIYSDARDLDRLASLFVPDVRVGRDGIGREALRQDFDTAFRSVGITFLFVGNHVIDFLDDEHAEGIVYTRAEIQDGGLDSRRWIIQAIQYHDRYERREENGERRWLFVRRRHFLVYGAELGRNPLDLPPAEWPKNQTGMGTHPHTLETWKSFWGNEIA